MSQHYENDPCEYCGGEGVIEVTYAEAGRDPGGSNDRAMELAGAVCVAWKCEECDGTGFGKCHRCGDQLQEIGSQYCEDCEREDR